MKVTGYNFDNEDNKIKAKYNININGWQLKGFKLYEDENKKLNLLMPSYMLEKPIIDTNGKEIKNRHITVINKDLNSKDLYQKLQTMLVDIYNKTKDNVKNEQGNIAVEENIVAPEFEKGKTNIKKIQIQKMNTENDSNYRKQCSAQVLVGAFQINGISLLYDTVKNEKQIMMPQIKQLDSNGEAIKNEDGYCKKYSFLIPEDKAQYKELKDLIINKYNEKLKEIKAQAQANNKTNYNVQSAAKDEQFDEEQVISAHQ